MWKHDAWRAEYFYITSSFPNTTMAEKGLPSFRVSEFRDSEFPSFRVSEIPSFRDSEFPSD